MTLIPIIEKTQICFVHCGKEVCKCNPSKTIKEMKQIELITKKGEFAVVDYLDNVKQPIAYNYLKVNGNWGNYKLICKLSEVTEFDAKCIVNSLYSDTFLLNTGGLHNIYGFELACFRYDTALECLEALLTSKGIDINNGNRYLFKKV